MNGPDHAPPEPPDEESGSTSDRLLAPLYQDSTLWGLLVVMALVMATFLASILLMSLERRPFALAALAGVAWISLDAVRRSASGGPTVRLIAGLWLLASGIAAVAHYGGLF